MERQVLVVKRATLFNLCGGYFNGFKSIEEIILSQIEKSAIWMEKKAAEQNPNFKQIIGYCSIINKNGVFFYRRGEKGYEEKRLRSKWSLGVGGHVESYDGNIVSENGIIMKSIEREISEEVDIKGSTSIFLIGGINDDDNDVGKVHFGLYFIVKTDAEEVSPKSKEIAVGGLKNIKEAKFILPEAEGWSKICFPVLQLLLENFR